MSKTLVIVESPAKSKTIQKYLGDDYIVKASLGHIRDLPKKELGIDIENNFKPNYVVMEGKEATVKGLQELAKKVDYIYLASDPDREGEAISWHLENLLKKDCKNIKRVKFNEITKDKIKEVIKNPENVDLNLVNSQQARRILDRIVGYQLSPWLNRVLAENLNKGQTLSAGRVQSVALRIVCDRERTIINFKPEEYWKIYANLTPLTENFPFDSELYQFANNKIEIKNKQEADKVLNDLNGKPFVVKKVERKEKDKKAEAPFTTSTLQQEAFRKLKFDNKKTMQIAQQLYEGIELGDGSPHGLITYMRTDSTRISEDFQKTTLDYIRNKWGARYAPNPPNTYKTKGDAQDAHEAIRPTQSDREPDAIRKYLNPDQYSLYKLIWERYTASQMSCAILDTVTIFINAGDYQFKSSGYSVKFDGFMTLYIEDKDNEENEEENNDKDKKLPNLKDGDSLKLLKLNPKQKFTQPPPRFTPATLTKELERLGVGRPSTYATIISILTDREYLKIEKQKFIPTQLGYKVVDMLVKYFENVMEIKFTAEMENKLDLIAEGKYNWVNTLSDFYQPFADKLKEAKSEIKAPEVILSDKLCPVCQIPMAIKKGQNGSFLACTNYPECKETLPYIDESQKTSIKCDKCGNYMFIKTITNGKKTEKFLACSNYPECKNTMGLDEKGNPIIKKVEQTDKVCPDCGKPMLLREGKQGKFYACSGYPECKKAMQYIDPNEKTIPCPECDSPMTLRKGTQGMFYACSRYPECKKTAPYIDPNAKITPCPDCGKPMILRDGSSGKFYACSGYPDCKKTMPYIDPKQKTKPCPKCNKPMIVREGKQGKFYACTGYPECKETAPYGPTKKCSKCGKPMSKRNGAKGPFWGCTGYPECKNIENV